MVGIAAVEDHPGIYSASFSSEFPCQRMWGKEILSHAPGACDTSRFDGGAVPLLFEHNPSLLIGKVESAEIKKKRGYCTFRFSNDADAQKRKAQVDEGVLVNISFAYEILEYEERGRDEVLITKWRPVEISLVSVPIDPTVGCDRSMPAFPINVEKIGNRSMPELLEENKEKPIDLQSVRAEESMRVRSILALGNKYVDKFGEPSLKLANELVESGVPLEGARSKFLDLISNTEEIKPVSTPAEKLDLSPKEQRSYSIIRAVQAFIDKDWSKAGFELECSQEMAKRSGGTARGFFVPIRDLQVDVQQQRAPYITTTPAAAGRLIETTLMAENFIDLLRNKPMCMKAGARMLTGLVGNVDIPRQNGTGTVFWVAEGSGPTDVAASFDLVSLRPRTLGVLQSMTRQMMLQATPDIENLVRADMLTIIALEIDRATLDGSGAANQPRGILNTAGIGSVAMGANGGAITYDAIIDLETAVMVANADDASLRYMTNAKVIGALKKLKETTGAPLWIGETAGLSIGTPGYLNGYPVMRTNQIPANKTKGTGVNLSSVVYGDFSQVLVGDWGVLDILPNPYGSGYAAGNIEIRALQTLDIAIRQPAAFSAITDVVA